MKNIELANKVISYCEGNNTIETVIELIRNHPDKNDVIDYVLDGNACVCEQFELVFTCAEFLEYIDENEEKNLYRAIEEAKQLLKNNGYYVDNIWTIEDVKNKFNCTDKEAYECLDDALSGEWICGEIQECIRTVGDEMGLIEREITEEE